MTGRATAVQGGLAALGLIAAHLTWQRDPEPAPGEAVILDVNKGDLVKVRYEDDNVAVELQPRREGGEPAVWLHLTEKTKAPPPRAHGAPPPKPDPKPATLRPPRDLRGDVTADRLIEQLAPFRSPRSFGVLDAAKTKELGLDAPKKRLTITARGEDRQFVIGQPQGSGEHYVRDTRDGRIYLMPRTVLSDLEGASFRLIDKRLHTFKIADVDRVAVSAGGKTRELAIIDRQSPTGYKLAAAKTPDKPEEMARNWHDKIWRIFPADVLGKGEKPPGGEPKVAARIEYFDGKKSAGWVEIARVEPAAPTPPAAAESTSTPPPPPPGDPARAELYARTEHTAGWVRITTDPSYIADAEKVASGS